MSTEFITYAAIALVALLIALMLVRPRNAFDLSRCSGWYLLVFLATYVLRPAATQLTGDTLLYQLMRLGHFEDHWHVMVVAVPLAIISFGIGYAATAPRAVIRNGSVAAPDRIVDPHKVRVLIVCLIMLGYFALIVSWKTGTMGGEAGDYEGVTVGVYEHNTAWFAQDDLFISTATILYYILTSHMGMSLLLAAPWMGFRIIFGWGRSHLLGHFFALMAVYFLKARIKAESDKAKVSQAMVISLGVLVVLLLFPLMAALRTLKGRLHMGSEAISKDALQMVGAGADPQDLLMTYLGTNSSITGFESTMSHVTNDSRSDLGVFYLYYYVIKPVPRIIWPGKGTPYTWAEQLRGIEADPLMAIIGAAPGSIGMAYQEWGWLGIPFEFILTGWLLRKSEEAARRRPNALHVQLGYAGLYSMVPQLGRDSLLYMIADFWLFQYGIPMFILWRISKASEWRVRMRGAAPAVPAAGTVSGIGV